MKNSGSGYRRRKLSRVFLCVDIFLFHLAFIVFGDAYADMTGEMAKCEAMEDQDLKLDCYGRLAKQKALAPSSMLEKLYELNKESRDNPPTIQWHNPNYFLFAAYNTTPNRDMLLDVDPGAKAQNTEAKF